jgi:chaperonin GroES
MMRMLRGKVGIAPIHDPKISKGGIFIPDIAKTRSDQGIIKYMGLPELDEFGNEVTTGLEIGMHVVYSPYDGTNLQVEGERELIIMPARQVKAQLLQPKVMLDTIFKRQLVSQEEVNKQLTEMHVAMTDFWMFNKEKGTMLELARVLMQKGFVKQQYETMAFEEVIDQIANEMTEKRNARIVNREKLWDKPEE